jgi:M6 family metalloprotease-like protein
MQTRSASRCLKPLALCLLLGVVVSPRAATLQDFGYQHMRVNGQLSVGHRPLLVPIFRVEGGYVYDSEHTPNHYYTNIFNLFGRQTLNGYHFENSNGRFYWTPAGPGTIGPINVPIAESYAQTQQRAGGVPELTDLLYYSNLVVRVMTSGLINLAQFDTDGNQLVTGDELHMLFILNEGDTGGVAAREPGLVKPPGFSYGVNIGLAAGVQWRTPFDSTAHELTHTFGAKDLYADNCWNIRLTLMSCTSGEPDGRQTFHVDPWHKMSMGWSDPRIRSLRAGGLESLSAAQEMDAAGQVILFDPARGVSEYFILEYRTAVSPTSSVYDQNVAGNGLVIWYVKQQPNHDPVEIPSPVSEKLRVAVLSAGAPDLALGVNVPWGSGTTPYLSWLDGTQTRTRIHVRPFNTGDENITIEILAEEETWVDFNYTGSIELGTFTRPYNTLTEGLSAVSYGGFLKIKTGTTSETATFAKPMRVEAYGGWVTLGQ